MSAAQGAAESAFSQTYAEARGKVLAAAEAAGLDVQSHAHPMLGRDGEALAMDVVRLGAVDAPAVLLVTSACHGVEGFCGSGVQVAWLRDRAWLDEVRASGVALLLVHALNPYGFSWWRRTTHENVDLNRNFRDFSQPLPANPGYDALASAVVPAVWPPTVENEAALQRYAQAHGERALQEALSGGQYTHPQGIFFGGHNPTWSNLTLRQVLRQHGRRCRQIGWIDLHTGLGPSGHGEKIFAGPDDAEAVARARRWWGDDVTSIYDGSSTSARLSGLMWLSAGEECPQAVMTGIALEYGTLPLDQVLDALRADQWLENHPEVPAATREALKRKTREAFYTDTPAWKEAVLLQALDAARAALAQLSMA